MIILVVNCEYNIGETLIDCAFQKVADAEAYIHELNSDKTKAIARCKKLIALRDSESMVQYLVEEHSVKFKIVPVDLNV